MRTRPPVVDALEPRRLFDTLTPGVSVETAVTAARPNKNWTIDLVAGQAIYVAAGETTASAFQTQLILIAPTRKAIARGVGDSGAFVGKVAPVSGTYIVRVRDTAGTNRSGVTLTAFYTGPAPAVDSDDAGVVESGRRYATSISPGDLDVWRIDAEDGQFLSIVGNENSNASPVGIGVAVIGPDGAGVTAAENDTGFILDVPEVRSGTYYAVVFEPGANASGRYGISFGLTPGVQYDGDPDTQQPLVSGTPRNGDLPSGDVDVFQVSVNRRQRINLTLARNGGAFQPAIQLIDPNGDPVAFTDGTSTASLSYRTLLSGTYSILARNRGPGTGGLYRLSYSVT